VPHKEFQLSENGNSWAAEYRKTAEKRSSELQSLFVGKCPSASSLSGVWYVSLPMNACDWIPMIEFRNHRDGLILHIEDKSWWLTSRSSIHQGTNLLELEDDDPLFEEKLLTELGKYIQ
jgi:hypothetical protein